MYKSRKGFLNRTQMLPLLLAQDLFQVDQGPVAIRFLKYAISALSWKATAGPILLKSVCGGCGLAPVTGSFGGLPGVGISAASLSRFAVISFLAAALTACVGLT
jgi:hypothetical protein